MARAAQEMFGPILRDVSRSFYLTLRVLPPAVRAPISLAYLLARTTDTIADLRLISAVQRLEKLRQFRAHIQNHIAPLIDFADLAGAQDHPAECRLLQEAMNLLRQLHALPTADRAQVQWVLNIITQGQEQDLEFFGDGQQPIALPTAAALHEYTYRVAGCVGEFWTRLTRAHCFPKAAIDEQRLLADAVCLGRGLQLVNILRDLPNDLHHGRCYLPATELTAAGLQPAALLDARSWPMLKPIYDRWLAQADDHLAAGWAYTNALPFGQYRLRLACAWPILIGRGTLRQMRAVNPLQKESRIRVSRAEVRRVIWQTTLRLPFRAAWEKLFTTP